jgi:hypothetical protein
VVEPMWLARRDTAAAVEAPAADTAVALQNP